MDATGRSPPEKVRAQPKAGGSKNAEKFSGNSEEKPPGTECPQIGPEFAP